MMTGESRSERVLVTGFPSYTSERMIQHILKSDTEAHVFALVGQWNAGHADDLALQLPDEDRKRLSFIAGDVSSMDLRLSTRHRRLLTEQLTSIQHIAGCYHVGHKPSTVEHINVGGTHAAVELALECKRLRRFIFWSTAFVSGDRIGVVMADELMMGQKFENSYERTKAKAEEVVRKMSRRVPATIVRPGLIVGDSQSGEIGRFDGPYNLIGVMTKGTEDMLSEVVPTQDGPFHLVPIDYVIAAAYRLGCLEEGISKTFHLVDPSPLSGRGVVQLVRGGVAEDVTSGVIPRVFRWATTAATLPKLLPSRPAITAKRSMVFYNCSNTREALRGSDIWCPALASYIDNLVGFARSRGRD